jgi:GAF domain-containing protein
MEIAKAEFQQLLQKAIAAEGAVKGTLQRHCKSNNRLEIIASEGFAPEFLKHFKSVKPFDSSCCGRAFGVGSTIIISDVEKDVSFKPNLAVAHRAGFRAVKSVPIFDSKGNTVGVLSTHFKEPKTTWDTSRIEGILKKISKIFEEHPVLEEK